MSGFFPVDRNIFTSSIWLTGTPEEKCLWWWLLGNRDDDGVVRHRELAIAEGAKLPRPVVEAALRKFSEPDPDSRTRDNDGRRIEWTPDGFVRLLNHELYYSRDYSTPRWRKWNERRKAAGLPRKSANALARLQPLASTKDKDTDKDTNNDITRPLAATPPAPKRSSRPPVTPDVLAYIETFNDVFRRATGRRASLAPGRYPDFVARLASGFPAEFLIGLPVGWLATSSPDAERVRSVRPDFLLRDGSRTYRRGDEVRPTFDWLGSVWGALDRVRLTPELEAILADAGVLDWWKARGAVVAQGARTW